MHISHPTIFLLLSLSLAASRPCDAQSGGHTFSSPTRVRLTCLILGYDSIIYYTGDDLRHATHGKLTDTLFIDNLFQQAKATGNPVVLKPCGGADVIPNLQQVMNRAVTDGTGYSVDSTDAVEESTFNAETPEMIKEMLRNPDQPPPPISVTIPTETIDTTDSPFHVPLTSQVTIELSGDKGPFVYVGREASTGKYYTTSELQTFFNSKSSDINLSVRIRTTRDAAYHQLLDILDVLRSAHVNHFSLESLPSPSK